RSRPITVISGFAVKIIRGATLKVGQSLFANRNQIGKTLSSTLSTKKVEWVPSSPSRCWNSWPREAAAFYADGIGGVNIRRAPAALSENDVVLTLRLVFVH